MFKILVVDDERDAEPLFVQKFRKEIKGGLIHLHFAFSGEEAISYMETLQPFDLIMVLSDINMPGMTGLELLRTIKEKYPQLRVIMITAYGDESNFEKALQYGADSLLTKPIDFVSLKEKLFSMKL